MKHLGTYFNATIIILILAGVTLNLYLNRTAKKEISLGAYDTSNVFAELPETTINHRFMTWNDGESVTTKNLLELSQNGKTPMLTVEPWEHEGDQKDTLLESIVSGKYDQNIQSICKPVQNQDSQVYLRWGHEIDLNGQSRYSWAQNKPTQYIAAFRHWVDTCIKFTTKAKFIWSPAGVEGLEKFYPGDKYVHIVGLSIFGYPEYEIKQFGKAQNFNDVFNNRYDRVKEFKKPIFIAEFGVAGSDEYKKNWLVLARQQIFETESFPLLKGIIYFNGNDPIPWIPDITPPDFKIDPTWLIIN
jgi:beta-mannanase